jgi:hypothetical protein
MLGLPLLLGKGRRGCGAGYRVAGPQRDWHGRRTAPLRKENTPAGRPIPKVAQIPERGWLTRERAAAFGCRAVNDSSRRTAMSPRLKPSPRIRCLTKSLRWSPAGHTAPKPPSCAAQTQLPNRSDILWPRISDPLTVPCAASSGSRSSPLQSPGPSGPGAASGSFPWPRPFPAGVRPGEAACAPFALGDRGY